MKSYNRFAWFVSYVLVFDSLTTIIVWRGEPHTGFYIIVPITLAFLVRTSVEILQRIQQTSEGAD